MKKEDLKLSIHAMLHPVYVFERVKFQGEGSILLSIIILFLWFFSNAFSMQSTGFIFNNIRQEDINTLIIFASTFVLFFLWTVSNWALSTFMEGEGKYRDIIIASAYSILPYIILSIITTIISNFLFIESLTFLQYINILAYAWSIIMLHAGIHAVHQYSLKKTVLNIILSVFGIAAILFLFVLVFSLFQQLYIFFYTIFSEIMFRI